jgi:hypothetical protein
MGTIRSCKSIKDRQWLKEKGKKEKQEFKKHYIKN